MGEARDRAFVSIAQEKAQQSLSRGEKPALRDLLVQPSWLDKIGGEFDKPYMKSLEKFLHQVSATRSMALPYLPCHVPDHAPII